ncbi:MAG: LysE family translocator [Dehalococcoidia bacterium]|jgi:threonine/homoserine/homoserine lactone efflux protein|nr:LysE family translocator [Dehalococcoidia bacterium]
MSIELWLAFVAASAVVLIVPGPTVFTVVSYSIAQGRRASLPVVAGVALGDATAVTVSVLGLGALLATSAFVFAVIKLAGGLYLLYLGIRLLRAGAASRDVAAQATPDSRRRLFLNTYLVTALNPQSIIFFVAFLPQFVNRGADVAQQLWLLALTFVVMATMNATMYSTFAAAANRLLNSPQAQRRLNLAGGCLLVAAALWVLFARHSS